MFNGMTAVATGGGSGIGAAITRALIAAGADVVCADIDLDSATQVALSASGPGTARAVELDVTDAAAVEATVAEVVDRSGRIDLTINNAGILFNAPTEELTLAQWNKIIDVNLRGVVHGVAAAYPRMVAARSGHIVTMASAGGLVATGFLTSYVATKHAVVGLSVALRGEAKGYGVGVTTVRPSAVETPMLNQAGIGGLDGREFLPKTQRTKRGYDPERLAADILRGIQRDRPLLVVPRLARSAWRAQRFAPALVRWTSARNVERQRRDLAAHAAAE